MHRPPVLPAAAPWLVIMAGMTATPCLAQQQPEAAQEEAAGSEPAKKKKKPDVLFAPVPISNPSSGTGLAGGAVAFYNPNNEPQQWVSGAGAVYTDRGTRGIAGFHTMSFGQDRMRFRLIASYIESHDRYYGTGAEDGDRNEFLELRNKQLSIQLQGMLRIRPHLYAGLRYKLATWDAAPHFDEDEPPSPVAAPPADQLESTLSVFGPIFAYDTRDSATQPRRGAYASANWLFGIKALGDSFAHNKLQLSTNVYFPAGPKTVLATRGAVCSTGGDVPFYDLCLFGTGADLRGYVGGRYRDGASWAFQGELRHQISNRWGGVAFFGLGGIAPSAGSILNDSNLLPSAGVGGRYRPFKDNDVQLRFDVAIGKDGGAFYFGISEAF